MLPETGAAEEAADIGILQETEGVVSDGIVRGDGDLQMANRSGIQKTKDNHEDDTEQESNEEPTGLGPTTRWDVFQALQNVTIPGNFCAGGCADGSTTITPNLPTTLGLRVSNRNNKNEADAHPSTGSIPIPLPITDALTQQLRTMSWKVDDESYHNVRQIEPECIKITNPNWEASLSKLLRTAALQLGVAPGHVRAELDMLLLFQRGSSIDRCCNTGEDENVLGTLMVQIPSVFTGGEIRIYDDNNDDDEEENDENFNGNNANGDDDIVQTFDLGAGARSTAPFSCHYLCHYADCDYEMDKIKSGTRLMLMYSLIYEGNGPKPTALRRRSGMDRLERSMETLPPVNRIFAVPLDKTYGSVSLATLGINALKVKDRGTIETIRAAGKEGWKLMIIHATRVDVEKRRSGESYSYDCWGSYDHERVTHSSSQTELLRVVDEDGKESVHAKDWLSKAVSLDSCEGNGMGMTLSRAPTPATEECRGGEYYGYSNGSPEKCEVAAAPPYSVGQIWGSGKVTVKKKNPYDSRYGMYETRSTHTTSYSSSFLLAYDESSMFELNCLSGGDAINKAAKQICKSHDFGLLKRLLSIMENSPKCKCELTGSSCDKLLRFILTSPGDATLGNNWKGEYSDKVLRGLATTVEPSEEQFALIRTAIKRLGWRPLCQSVSRIIHNGCRKYMNPLQFLVRAGFLIELRSTVAEFEEYEVDASSTSLTETCFSDFPKSSRRSQYSGNGGSVLAAVETLVDRHGWTTLVERAVGICLDAIIGTSCTNFYSAVDMAQLLLKLKTIDQAALVMERHLEDFVTTTASLLSSYYSNGHVANDRFSDLFSLFFQYGKDNDVFENIGAWAMGTETRFASLVDMIKKETESDGLTCPSLPQDLLNKCLVRKPTPAPPQLTYDYSQSTAEVPANPIQSIQMMLENFPQISQTVDSAGRISLHHAAASDRACFETVELLFEAHPKGASIVDPVTGMYPFQLAGASDNMDATFKLLQADPSLIGGALREEGKKRKRSPSMDEDEY